MMCGLVRKGMQRHTRPGGERVVARQRDHDRLAEHGLRGEAGFVDRQGDESHVQASFAERAGLFRGAHVPHDRADLRMPLRKCPENLDEDRCVGRPGRADGQLTNFALVQAERQIRRMRGMREDDARLLDEHPAGVGELDMALGPVKQRHTEFRLKLPESCWLSGGWLRCSRSAARPKWSVSATVTT